MRLFLCQKKYTPIAQAIQTPHSVATASYVVHRLFTACSPLVHRSRAAEKRRKITGQNPAMRRRYPMGADTLPLLRVGNGHAGILHFALCLFPVGLEHQVVLFMGYWLLKWVRQPSITYNQ